MLWDNLSMLSYWLIVCAYVLCIYYMCIWILSVYGLLYILMCTMSLSLQSSFPQQCTGLLFLNVTRLMCSPLAGNFWSTPVLVHKGLIHGVMTSLPWQTGLQYWQSCTIALAHSVGYKWRIHWDSPSEGLISYMWIQTDSDLTCLINFQGVCVTRLMCSPLAGNFWSTPVLVHGGISVEPRFVANWMCKCNGAWLLALETSLPRQRSHDTMY